MATLAAVKARIQDAMCYINGYGVSIDRSDLHNTMNTLGEKWGVSFLTGFVRSVYAVAKMATHVALAALCFVCAITLGCFGIGTNPEKTHVILKGFSGKTSDNLDEFKDGAEHFRKGIAETFQLCALARSIRDERRAKEFAELRAYNETYEEYGDL